MFLDKSQFDPAPEGAGNIPEKTGPARFFQILQSECLPLIGLNLLFLVCCLPVVTIPPALFAALQVVRRMVLDKPVSCWRDYRLAWKSGWKRAYGAFAVTALPMAAGGYGAAFYLHYARRSALLVLPFAFCTVVFLVSALSSTYLYGLLCGGRSLKEAIRPALLLGVARPLRAVLAALCWYGLPLLAILFFPLSGSYLALLGFALPFLLGSFYTRTVLGQFCGGDG